MDSKGASDYKAYQNYVKICEEEAPALTGIEFDTLDRQGRPSLDFGFRQGSGWTFGELRKKLLLFMVPTFTDYRALLYGQSA